MSSDALILAMVARILADAVPRKGKKINRKEVHRLLDTHVTPSAPWKGPRQVAATPTGSASSGATSRRWVA